MSSTESPSSTNWVMAIRRRKGMPWGWQVPTWQMTKTHFLTLSSHASQNTKYSSKPFNCGGPALTSADSLYWKSLYDRSLSRVGTGCLVQKKTHTHTQQTKHESKPQEDERFGPADYSLCIYFLDNLQSCTLTPKVYTPKQIRCKTADSQIWHCLFQLYKFRIDKNELLLSFSIQHILRNQDDDLNSPIIIPKHRKKSLSSFHLLLLLHS